MRKKFKRKKGPVRSKKVTVDGIQFASGLEVMKNNLTEKVNLRIEEKKRC